MQVEHKKPAEIEIDYPTSDGRPMAETDLHRDLMIDLIETLKEWYRDDPMTYVSGNILLFYEEGNRRRHVSPDVLVTQGIAKKRRNYYLLWSEGKPPDLVIEVTSKTTAKEDIRQKFSLYRDTLKIKEFFLFDPREEYLEPSFQGHKLSRGVYKPIAAIENRIPSSVLGLHLERVGTQLRLYDPVKKAQLPTREESLAASEAARKEQAKARRAETKARQAAEAEVQNLREEIARLRGDSPT